MFFINLPNLLLDVLFIVTNQTAISPSISSLPSPPQLDFEMDETNATQNEYHSFMSIPLSGSVLESPKPTVSKSPIPTTRQFKLSSLKKRKVFGQIQFNPNQTIYDEVADEENSQDIVDKGIWPLRCTSSSSSRFVIFMYLCRCIYDLSVLGII